MSTFIPSGCITLTTDFGVLSPFVGMMKAVIHSKFAEAKVIDLFHGVTLFHPEEAGFWLGYGFVYSPTGSVHIAVVDPGVGSDRDIIVAECDGHVFMAPDNGLLSQAFADRNDVVYRALDLKYVEDWLPHNISSTFHGRDIFAPVAAGLASGKLACDRCGPEAVSIVPSKLPCVKYDVDTVEGVVISIDHYGNVISNIEAGRINSSQISLECAGVTLPVSETYSGRAPGELVVLVNSIGVFEVASVQGSAAERLGIHRGASVIVKPL